MTAKVFYTSYIAMSLWSRMGMGELAQ